MGLLDGRRKFAIMLDYQFGKESSACLPRDDLKFYYSRRSARLKKVTHEDKLFATIRPNGAIALSPYSASILISSKAFRRNSVTVKDETATFVREGKSVFCKFVVSTGGHFSAGSEVVVLDEKGNLLGVGRAKIPGAYMGEFNAGVAVKVRSGYQ